MMWTSEVFWIVH